MRKKIKATKEAANADEEDSSLNSNTDSGSISSQSEEGEEDILPSRFTHDSGQILEAADADEMDEVIVASSAT